MRKPEFPEAPAGLVRRGPRGWSSFRAERDQRPEGGLGTLLLVLIVGGVAGAAGGLFLVFRAGTYGWAANSKMLGVLIPIGAVLGIGYVFYLWVQSGRNRFQKETKSKDPHERSRRT